MRKGTIHKVRTLAVSVLVLCVLFCCNVFAAEQDSAPAGIPSFGGGQMPNGQMPDFDGEMPDFEGGQIPQMPDGEMPEFGGEMPQIPDGEMPTAGEENVAPAADTQTSDTPAAEDDSSRPVTADQGDAAEKTATASPGNMPQSGSFDPGRFSDAGATDGNNETLILLGASVLVLIAGILIAWKVKH